MSEKVFVSACLCGIRCRYNGKKLEKRKLPVSPENMVLVCPEVLAGMKIPRTPSFFDNDKTGEGVWKGETKVVSEEGEDRTEHLKKGALKALEIATKYGIKKAYLKEKSPSCGVNLVYVGSEKVMGKGVTASLFEQNGIEVIGVD